MSQYTISEEQLEAFAKDIYEEACCSYMDLKDSFCYKKIKDFLSDKKQYSNQYVGSPVPLSAIGSITTANSWTLGTDWANSVNLSNENTNTVRFIPPENTGIRNENYVRIENHLGN